METPAEPTPPDSPTPPRRPSGAFARLRAFIARQWDDAPSARQRHFDVVFGVLAPPLLFVTERPLIAAMDPIGAHDGIVIGRVYALPLALVAAVTLVLWHRVDRLPARFRGLAHLLCAGLFAAASAVSCGVGLLLLPMSLVGLFVLVGVLGFVPFLTSYALLRNALRARRRAVRSQPQTWSGTSTWIVSVGVAGAVLLGAAAFGFGAKRLSWRDTDVLLGKRDGDARAALRRMRVLRVFPGVPLRRLDREFIAAHNAADGDRIERAESVYEGLGIDVPEWLLY